MIYCFVLFSLGNKRWAKIRNQQFKVTDNGHLKNVFGGPVSEKNMGPPGGPAHAFFAATPQVRYSGVLYRCEGYKLPV
jgi:hypothetical protein